MKFDKIKNNSILTEYHLFWCPEARFQAFSKIVLFFIVHVKFCLQTFLIKYPFSEALLQHGRSSILIFCYSELVLKNKHIKFSHQRFPPSKITNLSVSLEVKTSSAPTPYYSYEHCRSNKALRVIMILSAAENSACYCCY